MNIFSYNDYLKNIHTIKLNNIARLEEENTEYKLIQKKDKIVKKENKNYNELIKNILEDKKELSNFINQFLKPNKILKEDDFQKYINNDIIKKYKTDNSNVIYRLKKQDIYFLIELKSTIDYNLPYQILNYCVDIIQGWIKERKNKPINCYPTVVPIIIYTGKEKWKIAINCRQPEMRATTYQKSGMNLAYNLIDINKFNEQVLLCKKTLLSYVFLIEKSKTKEELFKNIRLILSKEKRKEVLEKIDSILVFLLTEILKKREYKGIIAKEVSNKNIEELIERIVQNERKNMKILEEKIEKKTIEKVKREISNKLLNMGQDEKFIKDVVGIVNEKM